MSKKVVIIGGVAGGASAAARLRRLDEQAEIVIVEKGEAISYANCGLPYYIGDVIKERQNLFLQTPQSMLQRFRIDVRIHSEVILIDRERKEVLINDYAKDEKYRESYDQLVLSTGSAPIIPKIPGFDLERVFALRNIPDMDRIKRYLSQNSISSAVVIGGGFIGVEMAENLACLNLQVTLIELANQVLGNLDYEMAARVHQEMRTRDVQVILGNGVKSICKKDELLDVMLNDGRTLTVGMVIMAVGVKPEVRLAAEAGLELGTTGALRVNSQLQTADPNIYAVGDAVEVLELNTGKPYWVPLAGPANRQGRILADILTGRELEYRGAQGTSIIKVFDLSAGSTGLNEKVLKKWGMEYQTSITHSNSHAGYYPGASMLTIKLLYAPQTGQLYGAQVVGYDGVDKRLDVLATAIRFRKTVFDLTELELAYAPPFSSAKDPVNIAGYAAANALNGEVAFIAWEQLLKEKDEKLFLLDVREPSEVKLGAIDGAVNIPLNQLRDRLAELPADRTIVVYCQVGLRAYYAVRILLQNGFSDVKDLSGGFRTFSLVEDDRKRALEIPQVQLAISGSQLAATRSEAPTLAASEPLPAKVKQLNACGLQCPGPIVQVFQTIQTLNDGELLEVTASDPGFANDIGAWCRRTGNELEKLERNRGEIVALIRKNAKSVETEAEPRVAQLDKTIVVFSGDLDKALASFVIALGAASLGRKVTLFFTFWGLNIVRKPKSVSVAKDLMGRMFGMMMPRGSKRLGLSRMNMGGMGAKMIRRIMGLKQIDSLEEMIAQAQKMGVKLMACQMSMDVMGLKQEELLDGVEVGGVAAYLAAAEEGNVNLFI